MIEKILGLFDTIAGILILLLQFNIIPYYPLIGFALYLIVKGIIFFGDVMSFADGVIGVYMLLMILLKAEIVSYFFAGFLFIKGIISML